MKLAVRLPGLSLICVLTSLLMTKPTMAASTGVGSGGDIIDVVLNDTREILFKTLDNAKKDGFPDSICSCSAVTDKQANHPLCIHLALLTADQRSDCHSFVESTAEQILNMNRKLVPFELSAEPLSVEGSNGKLRNVLAMTKTGPSGPVKFYNGFNDSVRQLPTIMMLALMGHEFGHKARFEGDYVQDNPPIGAFDSGRELLDSVGYAIAWYAAEKGLVGLESGIRDGFSCETNEITSGVGSSSFGSSQRILFSRENFAGYETGIGNLPNDYSCYFNRSGGPWLFLRMKVHEDTGCAFSLADSEGRFTILELWRLFSPVAGKATPVPKMIKALKYPGVNPLCEKPSRAFVLEHKEDSRIYQFKVQYQYSQSGE